MDKRQTARGFAVWVAALLFATMPIVALLGYNDQGQWLRYVGTYYVAVTLFFAGTTVCRLNARLLGYLGALSYSIYLFGSASRVFVMRMVGEDFGGGLHGHLVILLAMLLAIGIAIPVYHLVEQPLIAAGRRLAKRLDGRRSVFPWVETI